MPTPIIHLVARCLLMALALAAFASPLNAEDGDSPAAAGKDSTTPRSPPNHTGAKEPASKWVSLFDGKTLRGWNVPAFGGEGEVTVEDGSIVLGLGEGITAIARAGEVPTTNYELLFEAKRCDGVDFFATTTFPVGQDFCSLVVGGWAGVVVGLSNVDGEDASDNLTTKYMAFQDNRWYEIRIRVSDRRVQAWIDRELVVDVPRQGHRFGIRPEVNSCRPLGISSWCTRAAIRNVRLRRLAGFRRGSTE